MTDKTVLFVCTGNSCRSVMAEGLFRKMLKEAGKKNIRVVSAGTMAHWEMPPSREVEEIMKRVGVDVSSYRSTSLTAGLIDEVQLILVMDEGHRRSVLSMRPEAKEKVFLLKEFSPVKAKNKNLHIYDPIGSPLSVYEKVFGEIETCLKGLLGKLEEYL